MSRSNSRLACVGLALLLLQIAVVAPADAQRVMRVEASPDLRLSRLGVPYRAVRQSDGKLIVGGDFSLVGSERRMYLARFNVDGSVDRDWNPGWSHPVTELAIDARDNLFVYGERRNYGYARVLGKIDRHGVRDAAWNPALVDGDVLDLLVEGDSLYVAGSFRSIAGVPRGGVARLDTSSGAVDLVWNPSPLQGVNCLLKSPGWVFLGGDGIAKVSDAGVGAPDPGFIRRQDVSVSLMAFDAKEQILAIFGAPIDQGYPHALVRVSAASGQFIDEPVNGMSDARYIAKIVADAAGNLLIAGRMYLSPNFAIRRSLIRVRPDGTVDPTFTPGLRSDLYSTDPDGYVSDVVLADGGNIDVVGYFDKAGQSVKPHIGAVRLDANGIAQERDGARTVADFDDIAHLGDVRAIVRDPASGSAYVGGDFKVVLDVPSGDYFVRDDLLKLDRGLALDATFAAAVLPVQALELTHAGELIVASTVRALNGAPARTVMKRLLPGGQTVATWEPRVNSGIAATIAMAPDGASLYLGGNFRFIDVEPLAGVARIPLSGNGNADPQFNPGANATVLDLAVHAPTGDLVAAGAFGVFGGADRPFLAKSNGNGVVDPGWRPAPDARINTAIWDAPGAFVFAGGVANRFGATPTALVAKIPANGNGAVDPGWNAGLLPGGEVRALALAEIDPESPGEEVLVGGRFDAPGRPELLISAHAQSDGAPRAASSDAVRGLQGRAAADDRVETLQALGVSSDGSRTEAVLVGGRFTELAGSSRTSIAAIRFEPDGLLQDGFE